MTPFCLTSLAPENTPVGRYLRDLDRKVRNAGVRLEFGKGSTLPYQGQENVRVSGFFIANPEPTLGVATGKPVEEWLQVLIHEGCHLDQWLESSQAWTRNTLPDGREAVDWLDDWCSGTLELSPAQLEDVVARAKQVELDCERRSLALIAAYGLPIDPVLYARRANAYVHFYSHVAKIRRWNPPDQAPYQLEQVWKVAPPELVEDATPELVQAFHEAYPPGA